MQNKILSNPKPKHGGYPTPVILPMDLVPWGFDTSLVRLFFCELGFIPDNFLCYVFDRLNEEKFPELIHINDDYALLEYCTHEEGEAFFENMQSIGQVTEQYREQLYNPNTTAYLYFADPMNDEAYEFNVEDGQWYLIYQGRGYA